MWWWSFAWTALKGGWTHLQKASLPMAGHIACVLPPSHASKCWLQENHGQRVGLSLLLVGHCAKQNAGLGGLWAPSKRACLLFTQATLQAALHTCFPKFRCCSLVRHHFQTRQLRASLGGQTGPVCQIKGYWRWETQGDQELLIYLSVHSGHSKHKYYLV